MVAGRRSLVLIVASVLLLSACGAGETVEGLVAHKAVTGVKDNTAYTILVNRPGDGEVYIVVKDVDYRDYFAPGDENAVVSESLEREMKREYAEVNYFVNVRLAPEDQGTQPYRVSSEVFNEMKVGSSVTFRTTGGELPEIVEVVEQTD